MPRCRRAAVALALALLALLAAAPASAAHRGLLQAAAGQPGGEVGAPGPTAAAAPATGAPDDTGAPQLEGACCAQLAAFGFRSELPVVVLKTAGEALDKKGADVPVRLCTCSSGAGGSGGRRAGGGRAALGSCVPVQQRRRSLCPTARLPHAPGCCRAAHRRL